MDSPLVTLVKGVVHPQNDFLSGAKQRSIKWTCRQPRNFSTRFVYDIILRHRSVHTECDFLYSAGSLEQEKHGLQESL